MRLVMSRFLVATTKQPFDLVSDRRNCMGNKSKDMRVSIIAAMRAAGIRPEIVYAYERTGFLLDEAGYKNLPLSDKLEYDAAIDAFLARRTND